MRTNLQKKPRIFNYFGIFSSILFQCFVQFRRIALRVIYIKGKLAIYRLLLEKQTILTKFFEKILKTFFGKFLNLGY